MPRKIVPRLIPRALHHSGEPARVGCSARPTASASAPPSSGRRRRRGGGGEARVGEGDCRVAGGVMLAAKMPPSLATQSGDAVARSQVRRRRGVDLAIRPRRRATRNADRVGDDAQLSGERLLHGGCRIAHATRRRHRPHQRARRRRSGWSPSQHRKGNAGCRRRPSAWRAASGNSSSTWRRGGSSHRRPPRSRCATRNPLPAMGGDRGSGDLHLDDLPRRCSRSWATQAGLGLLATVRDAAPPRSPRTRASPSTTATTTRLTVWTAGRRFCATRRTRGRRRARVALRRAEREGDALRRELRRLRDAGAPHPPAGTTAVSAAPRGSTSAARRAPRRGRRGC